VFQKFLQGRKYRRGCLAFVPVIRKRFTLFCGPRASREIRGGEAFVAKGGGLFRPQMATQLETAPQRTPSSDVAASVIGIAMTPSQPNRVMHRSKPEKWRVYRSDDAGESGARQRRPAHRRSRAGAMGVAVSPDNQT
jgi:hypothetical protein